MGEVIHLSDPIAGNGGTGTGWDGEVNTYAELPPFGDHLTEKYLVLTSTGSQLLFNLKRSGFYIAEVGGWRKLSNAQFLFNDNEFTVKNSIDQTKQIHFDVSQLATSTQRTATWQNKDGTVAYLADIPVVPPNIPEAPIDGSIYLRNGKDEIWQKLLGKLETFDIVTKEQNQNSNNGDFHGVFKIITQGYYSRATVQTTPFNLSVSQSFMLRVSYYRSSDDVLISQGELQLNNSRNGLTRHDIDLLSDFNVNTILFGVYCVVGVNDNVGGGTVQITRINANQLNDDSTSFQFNQSTGLMPATLPAVGSVNSARWQVVYGV